MPAVAIKEVMSAYAGEAVAHAREHAVTLDYSEESLDAVDRVFGELTNQGLLTPKSEEEEAEIWMLSKQYGGYVGQVVISHVGGEWELQDQADGSARVVLRSHGMQVFPLERVRKRLVEDEYSGVAGYCRALRMIIQRQNENA